MPRCPAGAMDEGPVDLRTRPLKGTPGAALPLRKRPLRPSVCGFGFTRLLPLSLLYPGPLVPIYSTPTVGPPFPLLNLPTHLYSRMCPLEHPLSADIALATRADEDGDTPLHIAVVQDNMAVALRLVLLFQQGGRELDVHNNLRQTPLHLAVITTLPEMVRLLVTAGASPMALDRHGQTAVHLACEHRSPSCLQALLDNAAPGSVDLEARNYEGESPEGTGAHRPARGREHRHGANVNAQMYSGSSALHSASGRGLLPLVRTLVRSGADSGLKNCHNDTPLMVARSRRVSVQAWGGVTLEPVQRASPRPNPGLFTSSGLQSSPNSSPSLSPPKDPPGFPVTPQNFFLPTTSPPAFLPFPGVLRSPPVPPSPAPGSS
ncbi:hypothetical protein A6R68_07293 [Neotoma lepida]|uniref:Uncharacterized protein n=1 Tax=Neotoma lepida TaxID=56216 RepID=A0A1A6GD68_NEOLE|nr:hypothetical protein A6R68_07293 [Neotoma lepida]